MVLLDAARGEYRWSVASAPAGGYVAEIEELTCTAVFTACPPGLDNARIVAPAPCEILVRCVDIETRESVRDVRILWKAPLAEGVHGGSLQKARWEDGLAAFRVFAPCGTVEIHNTPGPGYSRVDRSVEAGPGTTEVTLELTCLGGLRLIAREGNRVVRLGISTLHLVPAAGAPGDVSIENVNEAYMLFTKERGLYTLKVDAPQGYAPVPEATLLIEEGIVSEHVVELVRLP